MQAKQQLLLLEDIDSLGKKGEVVSAKSGYARNYLIPQHFAVVANKHTIRKQERLRQERIKQAEIDKKESLELVKKLEEVSLEISVKVDPEGHMYGSVSAHDVAELFKEQGIQLERKYIHQTRPIKQTGVHDIALKLKEGVEVTIKLHIHPEGVDMTGSEEVVAPVVDEHQAPEETPASEEEMPPQE